MKKILTAIFLLIFLTSFQAYANWDLYEITSVKETRIGGFNKGTVIEMKSGSVYQLNIRVQFSEQKRKPEAVVLRDGDGKYFKVIMRVFDEPLEAVQLVESDS